MKLSIDGGGRFLKVCLSILDNSSHSTKSDHSPKSKRATYDEGIFAKKCKDTGVKRLLLIGLVADADEIYSNLLRLFHLLDLYSLNRFDQFVIATDLKLTNIILGLMSHSSKHPCSWCNITKEKLVEKGMPRTLGSLNELFWSWFDSGSDKKTAMNHGNVVLAPIIKGSPDEYVIDIFPPPELHLLLGPVNKIFSELEKTCPEGAIQFATALHIEKECMYGGTFAGNACHKIISNVDYLESIATLEISKFVAAFRALKEVVSACYGDHLAENYQEKTSKFKEKYLDLDISVTPKVHTVFFHIEEFCTRKGTGLGRWSKQAGEAAHSDFKHVWSRYIVKPTHPEYGNRLLRAVKDYNSRHC